MDIDKLIKEIRDEKPEAHSPFQYGEWYDGWEDAIEYVVRVLKRIKLEAKDESSSN